MFLINKKMRNMNKKNTILFFLLLISLQLMAQRNFNVTGKVVSATDGLALPGVNVLIKGQQIGTATDFDGQFSINIVKGKDILVFSMIGFTDQEFSNINQSVLNVQLSESVEELESVLVIGYGTQKKASSVGSISQVKGDDLLRLGSPTNVSSSLTGQLPGVTSIQTSGEPGSQTDIFIRGRGTWGYSDPLILVDGVERSYDGVDPNEIETISVLKDASATAVYGVRGGNGVILITTKRGKEGDAKISFNTNIGFKRPTYLFEQLDQVTARELYNEARRAENTWDRIYSPENIDNWRPGSGSSPYYYPEIDWGKEVLRDFAVTQQYNLNVSGGNSKFKYFTSLGYLTDGDIYKSEKQPEYDPRFRYKRYNYRSNLDFSLSKSATLSLNVAGEISERNRPLTLFGNNPFTNSTSAFYQAIYTAPTYLFPIRYENGILGATPIGRQDNPIYNLNYQGGATQKSSRLFTDFTYNQKLDALVKGLSGKARVSYNTYIETRQVIEKDVLAWYQPSPDVEPLWISDYSPANEWVDKPAVLGSKVLSDNTRDLYYEFSLNYANSFDKHDVSALALFNRRQINEQADFPYFQEDWVGRVTYGYADKYLAEYNASYTGSERFAPGLRYGYFGAYSVGWVATKETFFQNIKTLNFIDNLKFKFSYGEIGNDRISGNRGDGRFIYESLYDSGNGIYLGGDQAFRYAPLYFEGRPGVPGSTWEKSTKRNLGIEIGLFNKLDIEIDLYDEKRKDLLVAPPVSIFTGQVGGFANVGQTKSHGFELLAIWRDKIGDNFKYNITSSFTFQENRIIVRDDRPKTDDHLKQAGKTIGFNSGLIYTGINQSWDDVYNTPASIFDNSGRVPGDAIYSDYNADGIIDDQTDVVPYDLNALPAYTYSTNIGLSYKNFDLNANFYGVTGVEKGLGSQLQWEFYNRYVQAYPESLNRWSPETAATATRPRVGIDLLRHNRAGSTLGRYDASYFRLQSLELSYNLPTNMAKRLGATNGSFFISGNNLFTWTNFDKRIDPEGGTGSYPITKRYNIGFRLGF